MEFKNSDTFKNIRASLTGESLARNKYTFFAIQARAEGKDEIADLFEEMANNESVHAKIWFQYLNDGLGNTLSNLQNAASGEYDEWTSMYPEFAKSAREEGFFDIAKSFEQIAAIEKSHEHRFLQAYAQMLTKKNTSSAAPVKATEEKTNMIPGYRCMFCGATYETRPDTCEVCEAIGSFEKCYIEK